MDKNSEAIGIDLGGTNIRVARISRSGQILDRIQEHVPQGRAAQLAIIRDTVLRMVTPQSAGVALGFPGRVDVRQGVALTAGYLELKDVPLAAMLREMTGLPAVIDTDANLALWAEMKIGAAVGYAEIAMFTIGTGIGGAIASDGKLYYGGGNAGQLGHITVDIHGKPCKCGRRGCVETTSSGTALGELIAASPLAATTRVEDLLALQKSGDRTAHELLVQWTSPLRLAVDTAVAVLGSKLVLLGGGLGKAAFEALTSVTRCDSPWFTYEIKAGELGDHAGVIGAGLRAFEA